MSRLEYEIYAEQLFPLGYGLPLWSTDKTRPDDVQLGDVGFFWEGTFHTLFNSTRSDKYWTPVRSTVMPPEIISEHRSTRAVQTGPCISRSLKPKISRVDARQDLKFDCVADKGAMLILKGDAVLEQIGYNARWRIANYLAEQYRQWQALASVRLSSMQSEMIFVSGRVRTTEWALAAFACGAPAELMVRQVDGSHSSTTVFSGTTADASLFDLKSTSGPAPDPNTRRPLWNSSEETLSISYYPVFINYYKLRLRTQTALEVETSAESEISRVHPGLVPFHDPVDHVLAYIFKHSKARVAVASDQDIFLLQEINSLPSDLEAYLEHISPVVTVNDAGVGMLSLGAQSHAPEWDLVSEMMMEDWRIPTVERDASRLVAREAGVGTSAATGQFRMSEKALGPVTEMMMEDWRIPTTERDASRLVARELGVGTSAAAGTFRMSEIDLGPFAEIKADGWSMLDMDMHHSPLIPQLSGGLPRRTHEKITELLPSPMVPSTIEIPLIFIEEA
ncbi:hypothetical protein OBBRIDRAFT_890015 [Obba rivulosa]|uniref:Uncharacterized protein n=1 Tax=Obba rivulosa TaxID=1052685 RepID=A0A8E2DHN0_9APHY|nr:hypothetical protein OBBRIDRAFT_890015 [Obba rivulosa]